MNHFLIQISSQKIDKPADARALHAHQLSTIRMKVVCLASISYLSIILIINYGGDCKIAKHPLRPWTQVTEVDFWDENRRKFLLRQLTVDRPVPIRYPTSVEARRHERNCTVKQHETCGARQCIPIVARNFVLEEQTPLPAFGVYMCKCRPGEMLYDEYDPTFPGNIKSFCVTRRCGMCHRTNTHRCIVNKYGEFCDCKFGYTQETYCYEKRRKCDFLVNNKIMAKDPCVTNKGNKCIEFPEPDEYGQSKYMCICLAENSEDRNLPYSNCLGKTSECKQPLCIGFKPPPAVTIPGYTYFIRDTDPAQCGKYGCTCAPGWFGLFCSVRKSTPVPGSWTPWSACNPDCIYPYEYDTQHEQLDYATGTTRASGIGHRLRLTGCDSEDSTSCGGLVGQWQRCRVRTVCSGWVSGRLSTQVRSVMQQVLDRHNEEADLETQLDSRVAELTREEKHMANLAIVFAALIYAVFGILAMEMHYLILIWSRPVSWGRRRKKKKTEE